MEGSEMEATIGWTDGKPWEIAWGELRWTPWTDGKPWEMTWGEGRESVGNSLGRALLGGREMEAMTHWLDGER